MLGQCCIDVTNGCYTFTGGAKVGRLLGADMGIININPANSTETSDEGNNDRTSLEKDIITIVHANFQLDH